MSKASDSVGVQGIPPLPRPQYLLLKDPILQSIQIHEANDEYYLAWREVMSGAVACPVCFALVAFNYPDQMRHIAYHKRIVNAINKIHG